jgi:hypothetical protein
MHLIPPDLHFSLNFALGSLRSNPHIRLSFERSAFKSNNQNELQDII